MVESKHNQIVNKMTIIYLIALFLISIVSVSVWLVGLFQYKNDIFNFFSKAVGVSSELSFSWFFWTISGLLLVLLVLLLILAYTKNKYISLTEIRHTNLLTIFIIFLIDLFIVIAFIVSQFTDISVLAFIEEPYTMELTLLGWIMFYVTCVFYGFTIISLIVWTITRHGTKREKTYKK